MKHYFPSFGSNYKIYYKNVYSKSINHASISDSLKTKRQILSSSEEPTIGIPTTHQIAV